MFKIVNFLEVNLYSCKWMLLRLHAIIVLFSSENAALNISTNQIFWIWRNVVLEQKTRKISLYITVGITWTEVGLRNKIAASIILFICFKILKSKLAVIASSFWVKPS